MGSSRFLNQPMRHDALNRRFYRGVVALRGSNRIGYGPSEIDPWQCGCQQDHAKASLRSGTIEDGGPVEVRMRPNERRDTARPFDALPQVVAIVDRQNEKIILRRQRRDGPATKGRASCPAPQSGIVDIERHINRRQPRVKPNANAAALLKQLLMALEAVNEVKLGRVQLFVALI